MKKNRIKNNVINISVMFHHDVISSIDPKLDELTNYISQTLKFNIIHTELLASVYDENEIKYTIICKPKVN